MRFDAKNFLSAFLTVSLVWVFLGCAFLCGENESCGEDLDVSFETSAIFDETSHEDSCPIKASAKTTVPERMIFDFDSSTVGVSVFKYFSAHAVLPGSHEYQTKFYRPPSLDSHLKRPLVLRI